MKVKDLIIALELEDPEKEVIIHDADTGWFLPIILGVNGANLYTEPPKDCFFIYGEYSSDNS